MSELRETLGKFFWHLVFEGLEFLFNDDREVRHAAIGCYTILAIFLAGIVVCCILRGLGFV